MSLGRLSLRPLKHIGYPKNIGPLRNIPSATILPRLLGNQQTKAPLPLGARSTSYTPARFSRIAGDDDLVHKLQEEIDIETRELDEKRTKVPKSVGEFLGKGPFKVEHSLGSDWVILAREFGNEKIKAEICLSDINNITEDDYEDYDESVDEEDGDREHRAGSQDAKEEENDEGPVEFDKETLPCRITVTKSDGGCLVFDTTVHCGSFKVDRIQYYKDKELLMEDTPENDFKRARVYGGPLYALLDDDLKTKFASYLEERGFDCAFAGFIPEFAFFKENEEYISWLRRVQDFVKE